MATTFQLPNALADVMLLVGVDDNTGLLPVSKPDDDLFEHLFELDYEPQVLSALSATDMQNFFPFPHRDANYPPDYSRDSTELSSSESGSQRDKMATMYSGSSGAKFKNSTLKTGRSISVHPKMMRHMSVRRPTTMKTATTLPELPITDEVLRSIPALCFPDGMKLHMVKPQSTTHFLVLTDMSGNKSYSTCLTFYRSYVMEKDDQSNIYMSLAGLSTSLGYEREQGKVQCYVPHCCITISQFPYYTKMKECLSSMLYRIDRDPEEMIVFVKEYAHILTHTPVPPAGNVAVEVNLYQLPLTLMPSPHPDRPVIDFPMHFVFLCFHTEELLKILSCVLVEERLVFLSKNYALLTIVMETIRNLILPLKWRFTYFTVMPSNGLGYLQAPGTFMFGCHSRHKKEVEQIEGLVIVDIDEGKVQRTEDTSAGDNQSYHVPSLPVEAAKVFSDKCAKFLYQYELQEAQMPYCYSMEKLMKERTQKCNQLNAAITYAGLELMVNLLRGVVSNLRVEHNHFNKKEFLNQQTPEDRKFFERVVKTDMFKMFLKERMDEKTDYWYDQEMKTRGYGGGKSGPGGSASTRRASMIRQTTISQTHHETLPEITRFLLPDVTDSTNYLTNCIETLSKLIKESPDFDDRTSYHFLRALFHVASGNKMAAIDDLIDLSTTNLRILPVDLLTDLHKTFTESELVEFEKKEGHKLLLDLMEEETITECHRKIRMDPVTIPDRDLKYDEFVEFVSFLEMTNDHDTIKRLFDALTNGQKQMYVDQVTFSEFSAKWEDNGYVCAQIQVEAGCLAEEENILKVSRMIKSDLGIGRLVLTDKRIFFLSDVSNRFKEVVKLRNIKQLTKSQQVTFLNSVDILVITFTGSKERSEEKTFTAYLDDERNWWYMVIMEMWAGKLVAEATKDIMATQQAMQNTLLIDAVIGSGQHEDVVHHKNIEWAASHLAFYSKYKECDNYQLPPETYDALIYKVDPNVNERERKTVQALLYTGGEHGTKSPKLWCGLSDGKIKVYNAITWVMESEFIQARQCVACLTAVGDSQVWAGSFSIHIIDSETITCNKTLMEHRDLVVDIKVYNDKTGNYAFTASLDGTIIKWNLQKLTLAQPKIELTNIRSLRSLRIYKDKMLCGTWNSILYCDLEGNVLTKFSAEESGKPQELDSFTVCTNGEIWAGSRREGKLYVWDSTTKQLVSRLNIEDCKGISAIAQVEDRVWVGTKSGMIDIFTVETKKHWKQLKAHEDAVRVLCGVTDRYMVTGGGSIDGKVCIWSSLSNTTDSGSFNEK